MTLTSIGRCLIDSVHEGNEYQAKPIPPLPSVPNCPPLTGAINPAAAASLVNVKLSMSAGLPAADVLEVFGEHFLTYCLEHGYDKMLRTLGGNLKDFIQNLDSLHELLSRTYKDYDAPSFRYHHAEPVGCGHEQRKNKNKTSKK